MKTVFVALSILIVSGSASAQPRVANGDVRPSAVSGRVTRTTIEGLASKSAPSWVGYAVPAIDGEHTMCCWDNNSSGCCQSCRLEPGSSSVNTFSTRQSGVVALEAGRTLHVLFRVDAGRIDRIKTFSEECALDAGGLTLHWLTGVAASDSAATLAGFLDASSSNRLADGALTALAMHRDPTALTRLLTAARDGATTHIRGQALFWLAQRAGEKAAAAITEAIARDPETEVKKRAVFALSQLPRDEGVPLMIQVARTNSNAAVRKQAMFWLGQSKDPRAVRFFEEVLFK